MGVLATIGQQLSALGKGALALVDNRPQPGQVTDTLLDRSFPAADHLGIRIDPLQAVAAVRYGVLLPASCHFVGYRVQVLEGGRVSTTLISSATHSALMRNFEQQERDHGRVTTFPDLRTI